MNEQRLLQRLREGDTGALSEIIALYTPYLFTVACNIMDPPLAREDVEEAVSDAFVKLWTYRDEVAPVKLKPWLAAVTRNHAKDALRARKLAEPLDDDHFVFKSHKLPHDPISIEFMIIFLNGPACTSEESV